MMRLTVLGCSGSVPGPDSPASGYLLQDGRTSIVLDMGNGTLGALQRVLDPFELDGVVLSHLHPDHCADVSGLIVYRRYHPGGPPRAPLPLHGPSDSIERIRAAYATDVDDRIVTDLSDVFDFHQVREQFSLGKMEITAVQVAHPCEAFAVRVRNGDRTLVYSGDTGPCAELDELAMGADVLLAEASWEHGGPHPPGIHLSGHEAGETATRAGVGRLLLTHIPPWTDSRAMFAEASRTYDGPVEVARAGVSYDI